MDAGVTSSQARNLSAAASIVMAFRGRALRGRAVSDGKHPVLAIRRRPLKWNNSMARTISALSASHFGYIIRLGYRQLWQTPSRSYQKLVLTVIPRPLF